MDQRPQYKSRYIEPKKRKWGIFLNSLAQEKNRTLLAQALRSTIDKYNLMKPKSFGTEKDTILQTK